MRPGMAFRLEDLESLWDAWKVQLGPRSGSVEVADRFVWGSAMDRPWRACSMVVAGKLVGDGGDDGAGEEAPWTAS